MTIEHVTKFTNGYSDILMKTLPVSGGISGKRVEYLLSQEDSMNVTATMIDEDGFATPVPLGIYGDIADLNVQQAILIKLGLLP